MKTLRNDWHNTEINARIKEGDVLDMRQVRRYWTKLCGMSECECCNYAGERGKEIIEQIDFDRFLVH